MAIETEPSLAYTPLGFAESVIDLESCTIDGVVCWTHRPLAAAVSLLAITAVSVSAMLAFPLIVPGAFGLPFAVVLAIGAPFVLPVILRVRRLLRWREELRIDVPNGRAVYLWNSGRRRAETVECRLGELRIAVTEIRHGSRFGYKQTAVIAQIERAHFAIYRGKSADRAKDVLDHLKADLQLPEPVFATPIPILIKMV